MPTPPAMRSSWDACGEHLGRVLKHMEHDEFLIVERDDADVVPGSGYGQACVLTDRVKVEISGPWEDGGPALIPVSTQRALLDVGFTPPGFDDSDFPNYRCVLPAGETQRAGRLLAAGLRALGLPLDRLACVRSSWRTQP